MQRTGLRRFEPTERNASWEWTLARIFNYIWAVWECSFRCADLPFTSDFISRNPSPIEWYGKCRKAKWAHSRYCFISSSRYRAWDSFTTRFIYLSRTAAENSFCSTGSVNCFHLFWIIAPSCVAHQTLGIKFNLRACNVCVCVRPRIPLLRFTEFSEYLAIKQTHADADALTNISFKVLRRNVLNNNHQFSCAALFTPMPSHHIKYVMCTVAI